MINKRLSMIAVQDFDVHSYYTWIEKQDLIKKTIFEHERLFNLLSGRWKNVQVDSFLKTAQTAFNDVETMWFWDFLPNFIPHARIATYSYESNWWKTEMKTNLRKCDKQLFNVFHQNRLDKKINKIVLNDCLFFAENPKEVSMIIDVYWTQFWWIDHQTGQYGFNAESVFFVLKIS